MKRFIAVFVVLLMGSFAIAATTSGAVTGTEVVRGKIQTYTYAWTSDSSGDVVNNDFTAYGEIKRVVLASSDGASSPTTAYDVVLNDALGVDVLQGGGADVVTATDSDIVPVIVGTDSATTFPVFVAGNLTLSISNAGAAKTGTIKIIVLEP